MNLSSAHASRGALPILSQQENAVGEVNFEVLKYSTGVADQPGIWETTAYVLETGHMPPQGIPRPPEAEVIAARPIIETGLAPLGERSKITEPPPTNEWLTWQVDPERTGWAGAEKTLKYSNADKLDAQVEGPTRRCADTRERLFNTHRSACC